MSVEGIWLFVSRLDIFALFPINFGYTKNMQHQCNVSVTRTQIFVQLTPMQLNVS